MPASGSRHAMPYELVLTGLAIAWTVLPQRRWAVAVLAAWDTLACCYLAGIWLALRRNRLLAEVRVDTDRLPRARFTPAGSRATLLLTLVTSLAGMVAAGRVVVDASTRGTGSTVKVVGFLYNTLVIAVVVGVLTQG